MKKPARPADRNGWRRLGGALLVVALLCLLTSGFGLLVSQVEADPGYLPVSLHSVLAADYSADPRAANVKAVDLALIDAVVRDSVTGPTGVPGRLATVAAILETPVAFVTPAGGVLPTAVPPTATQVPPTAAPTALPTATGTASPEPSPTATLQPTQAVVTSVPTRIPVQPTSPVRPTDTPPPTRTAAPTATQPPPPTAIPPTAVPPTQPPYPPPYP